MHMQGSKQQDVFLNFPEHGLHLVFDGASQRLRLLELFDLSRMQVKARALTAAQACHSRNNIALDQHLWHSQEARACLTL